jgi:hypothetical protein
MPIMPMPPPPIIPPPIIPDFPIPSLPIWAKAVEPTDIMTTITVTCTIQRFIIRSFP